ncbi:MAG: hypothetical protein HF975_15285 [ANME-2 cluster archaeon]|nr:hypothetical protein [ANME-2 cluster archaeon]
MSTKMNKLVLLSALMIAIIGTFGTVSAEETVDLIASNGNGQGIDVGNVTVTNNATHIFVEFTTIEGWLLNETHLHIANESEEGIPQTKKGNPKVGQFDNSEEHEPCVDGYTYVIPLNELSGEVYIAAHAAVDGTVDGTTTYESAWGEGDEFNEGKNWAMYFTYTIPSTTQ